MLFLLFGSSGAGKTPALEPLRGRLTDVAVHDFDEIGVPPHPDLAWRHRATERWIERALAYDARRVDLVLAGQTPFGELLASPAAPRLEAISACLLDCADDIRLERLRRRGVEWLERASGMLDDYLSWAEWMRGHAADPQHMRQVIDDDASPAELHWDRWRDWTRGDPRWRVHVVDTSRLHVDRVVDSLVAWIDVERALFRSGAHPLARGWAK